MSFRENKALWLILIGFVVAILVLIWLLASSAPHTLVVLFPDVGDLKREDPVVWHGYVVGRVLQIEPLIENQVGVTIRINEDYAAKITRGTHFTLKRASLFGLLGSNAIELETPTESAPPYRDGERIQGTAPPRPTLVEQGKQLTLEYWQQLKDQVSLLTDEYKQSPYQREVEGALSELKSLAEEGSKQAKESLDQFRKDHQQDINQALKKLELARDWMLKQGDKLGARRLQDEIDKLKK